MIVMPRDAYIWVRVPPDVYDIWVNNLPRSVKREIGKKLSAIILRAAEEMAVSSN